MLIKIVKKLLKKKHPRKITKFKLYNLSISNSILNVCHLNN